MVAIRRLAVGLSIVAVAALSLSSCGDDDSAEPLTSSTTTPTTGTPAVTPGLDSTTTTDLPAASVPPSTQTAYLTDVQIESSAEGDNVVFTFDGRLPGYSIAYTTLPLKAAPSDSTVVIGGSSFIEADFVMSAGVKLTGGLQKTYTGPERIPSNSPVVKEVAKLSDYESRFSWAIGVGERVPFTVSTTATPSKIVVAFRPAASR